jgi:hypothetical protein
MKTIRKLVQIDDDGWCMEIDRVKLTRVAVEFKAWLLTLDPGNDPFGFLQKDLPLVEAALNGVLQLPYRHSNPHNWEIREGKLDWYLEIAAPFYNTIRGADRSIETITKDGKRYAWVDFEEA